MRNAQVAEWILSLVTSPERAASTVGDLMENFAERGSLWFWIGVLRTAVSFLWRDFSADAAHMMGLALRGFLLELAVLFGFIIGSGFAGALLGLVLYYTKTVGSPHPVLRVAGWVLIYAVAWCLIPFQIGRWLARRSPGRELAPVTALTILGFVVLTLAGAVWDMPAGPPQFLLGLAYGAGINILSQIPAFGGAVWIRRQRMAREPFV